MHCDSLGMSYVCSASQLFDQVLFCLFVCFIGWLVLGEGGEKEGGGGGEREREEATEKAIETPCEVLCSKCRQNVSHGR